MIRLLNAHNTCISFSNNIMLTFEAGSDSFCLKFETTSLQTSHSRSLTLGASWIFIDSIQIN